MKIKVYVGCDKSGKTTAISKLDPSYIRRSGLKDKHRRWHLYSPLLTPWRKYVFDRWGPIDNYAYEAFKDDHPDWTFMKTTWFDLFIMKHFCDITFMNTDLPTIAERLRSEPDEYVSIEEAYVIHYRIWDYLETHNIKHRRIK